MASVLCRNFLQIRSIYSQFSICHFINFDRAHSCRYFSSQETASNNASSKKFSKTVLLPKTEFPLWLDPRKRARHDKNMLQKCGFEGLYNWQRENLEGEEFILHDGPPYANGSPHVGHAVNKVLKDIIVRHKLLKGHKVHFVPGWDCHGLPIELKALTSVKNHDKLSPLELRNKARKFATEAISVQKEAFRSWGLLGDWDGKCYYTYDKEYVKNQLRCFFEMYEKELIYRAVKPIYWSPSTRTALAESELIYNKDHKDTCVTVRVALGTVPFNVNVEEPLYALIWTTTPWTLPANEAIMYKSTIDYGVVKIEGLDGCYLVAVNLISLLQKNLMKQIEVVQTIPGRSLKRVTYKHPFYKDEVHRFLEADHVTDDKGTGLVHCAPAHGREDYLVAIQNELPIVSLVDLDGNYNEEAGQKLVGKNITGSGSEAVRKQLESDIILTEELVHSYPYDWRSNKPVFMLASNQWFFDCSSVKEAAIEQIENVDFFPNQHYADTMKKSLKGRPFWCISRQRKWGVPIPVLYKRDCSKPIISQDLIEHYCQLIDTHGTDFWWSLTTDELCPQEIAEKLGITISDIERCPDILDIWFDSGLSWSAVLNDTTADLYLEGIDQFTGWFQSSLLTSIAVKGKSPYRKVFTHGFVVDENGHKMSKSLGNVIDPKDILEGGKNVEKQPAFGVDTMRWWVAAHSVQHANIPIGTPLLKLCSEVLHKTRSTIRYCLGVLSDFPLSEANNTEHQLLILDRYMMYNVSKLHENIQQMYEDHKYNQICNTINEFVVNEVSSVYCNLTKDRLYCEEASSSHRRACQFVIFHTLEVVLNAIAPIAPLLVEETYLHHPCYPGNTRYFEYRSKNPISLSVWRSDGDDDLNKVEFLSKNTQFSINKDKGGKNDPVQVAFEARKRVTKQCGNSVWKHNVVLRCTAEKEEILKPFVENQPPTHSQLAEILQVASVSLERLPASAIREPGGEDFVVSITPIDSVLCQRCRRHCVVNQSDLCQRCDRVVKTIPDALKQSTM